MPYYFGVQPGKDAPPAYRFYRQACPVYIHSEPVYGFHIPKKCKLSLFEKNFGAIFEYTNAQMTTACISGSREEQLSESYPP